MCDARALQVDVKALKEALWGAIQAAAVAQQQQQQAPAPLPFTALLAHVAAGGDGVSVHLSFICLLHLANEHGLELHDSADLATLSVGHVPGC